MATPAPDDLPLMPIGCWALPLGLAGTALAVNQSEEPGWWMLGLGIVFALFALAYLDRMVAARRTGRAARGQGKRALVTGAMAALFVALYLIGR